MKLLTGKQYITPTNNWYAPLSEFWEKHKSITFAKFINQCSSSGDWDGFIVQKTGKNSVVAIGFSQENNYPHDGFSFYTMDMPFYRGKLTEDNLYENIELCYRQC